jgi:hypothetical protein
MHKVTWNDIHEAHQQELKKTYKLTDRQLEQQVRKHLYGADTSERRRMYEVTYGKRR